MAISTSEWLGYYETRLRLLIQEAERSGVVLTIKNVPQQPLAMGNHRMVGEVRPARTKEKQ